MATNIWPSTVYVTIKLDEVHGGERELCGAANACTKCSRDYY
jgi:hypothetical protein